MTTTGAYSFRLLDFAGGDPIALDSSVTQSITPGKGSRVFSFVGTKGPDRLFSTPFRARGSVNSAPTWRLIDQFGNVVFSDNYDTDQQNVRLPSSGTYFLLIEGRRNETSAAPTVTFCDADGGEYEHADQCRRSSGRRA